MRQEKIGFWEAMASAGPYANNLHLTPECRQIQTTPTPHHSIFTGRPSCRPTNSVKALKATALVFRPEANFNFQERETLAASVYLAEAPPVSFCCGRRRQ